MEKLALLVQAETNTGLQDELRESSVVREFLQVSDGVLSIFLKRQTAIPCIDVSADVCFVRANGHLTLLGRGAEVSSVLHSLKTVQASHSFSMEAVRAPDSFGPFVREVDAIWRSKLDDSDFSAELSSRIRATMQQFLDILEYAQQRKVDARTLLIDLHMRLARAICNEIERYCDVSFPSLSDVATTFFDDVLASLDLFLRLSKELALFGVEVDEEVHRAQGFRDLVKKLRRCKRIFAQLQTLPRTFSMKALVVRLRETLQTSRSPLLSSSQVDAVSAKSSAIISKAASHLSTVLAEVWNDVEIGGETESVMDFLLHFGAILESPELSAQCKWIEDSALRALDSHIDALRNFGGEAEALKSDVGVTDNVGQIVAFYTRRQKLINIVAFLRHGQLCPERSSLLERAEAGATELRLAIDGLMSEWVSGQKRIIRSNRSDISLQSQGRLMSFAPKTGKLQVHLSDGLQKLLHDCERLKSIGLEIPASITSAVENSNSLLPYASQIRQVAHFHNTIASQILPFHRSMLLVEATSFEKTIKRVSAQSWGSKSQCEENLQKLQQASSGLMDKNVQLRNLHSAVSDIIASLKSKSVFFALDNWEDALEKIRGVFQDIAASRCFSSVEPWVEHCDKEFASQLGEALRVESASLCRTLQEAIKKANQIAETPAEAFETNCTKDDLTVLHDLIGHAVSLEYESGIRGKLVLIPSASQLQATVLKAVAGMLAKPLKLRSLRSSQTEYGKLNGDLVKFAKSVHLEVKKLAEGLRASLNHLAERLQDVYGEPARTIRSTLESSSLSDCGSAVASVLSDLQRLEGMQARICRDSCGLVCLKLDPLSFKNSYGKQLLQLRESARALVSHSMRQGLVQLREMVGRYSSQTCTVKSIAELRTFEANTAQNVESDRSLARAIVQSAAAGAVLLEKHFNVDANEDRTAREVEKLWDEFSTLIADVSSHSEKMRKQLREDVLLEVSDLREASKNLTKAWSSFDLASIAASTKLLYLDFRAEELLQLIKAKNEELDEMRSTSSSLCDRTNTVAEDSAFFGIVVSDLKQSVATLADEIDCCHRTCSELQEIGEDIQMLGTMKWQEAYNFRKRALSVFSSASERVSQLVGGATHLANSPTASVRSLLECVKLFGESIAEWTDSLPLLASLSEPALQVHHWAELCQSMNVQSTAMARLSNLTVADMLQLRNTLKKHSKMIAKMIDKARSESQVRESLDEVAAWIDQEIVPTEQFLLPRGQSVCIIAGWEDILEKLATQRTILASVENSAYFHVFEERIVTMSDKFERMDTILDFWQQIQRRWVFLAPVFDLGIVHEGVRRFNTANVTFRCLSDTLRRDSRLFSMLRIPECNESNLKALVSQLEECEVILLDFLERKRAECTRLYFIGDQDLLELLGRPSSHETLQHHISKLFHGIATVSSEHSRTTITHMQSATGENTQLLEEVDMQVPVEKWLNALEKTTFKTLRASLANVLSAVPQLADVATIKKLASVEGCTSQVQCLALEIAFCSLIHRAISSGSLDALKQLPQQLISVLTDMNTRESVSSSGANMWARTEAVQFAILRFVSVTQNLVKAKTLSTDHWSWQRQLRFYYEQGEVRANLGLAALDYGWEYQGNYQSLAHTHLTDKCYIVLSQALALGFGGNPIGPAGTGKTETVKAFGRALGRQVLVFNCDKSLDFRAMARIFTGLVSQGAFGCFDEFNRLKQDQLSAISQQIQGIQEAIRSRRASVTIGEHKNVAVNFNAGIFITMNPASREYGARSKLPANIKQLFKSVSMSVPDSQIICEVYLFSCGFTQAAIIAKKLCLMFKVFKQLLSKQKCYDFGLRSLKAIVQTAGHFMRQKASSAMSDLEVQVSCIRKALDLVVSPKLAQGDDLLFKKLRQSMWSTSSNNAEPVVPKVFREQYTDVALRLSCDVIQSQVVSTFHILRSLQHRIGVVVMGPSLSGKSTCLRLAVSLLRHLGETVHLTTVNPKAFERRVLLGYMDSDTRQWKDGIVTQFARQAAESRKEDTRHIIVFDGDIDPEWIEALNSVLDDNAMLSIPNGERIQFGRNVNFVFESTNLDHASPATVSRLGIIAVNHHEEIISCLQQKLMHRKPALGVSSVNVSSAPSLVRQLTSACLLQTESSIFSQEEAKWLLVLRTVRSSIQWHDG
ncbi:MAG: hypothetical protein MHM6MM_003668 [Cercozoa sp. M6MM]